MKPKIGRKIYCIYGDCILVDTVGFLGKDSFIVSSFGPYTKPDSWEWYYDSYDTNWFTSISKAKKKLIESHRGERAKLNKVSDTYYELEID